MKEFKLKDFANFSVLMRFWSKSFIRIDQFIRLLRELLVHILCFDCSKHLIVCFLLPQKSLNIATVLYFQIYRFYLMEICKLHLSNNCGRSIHKTTCKPWPGLLCIIMPLQLPNKIVQIGWRICLIHWYCHVSLTWQPLKALMAQGNSVQLQTFTYILSMQNASMQNKLAPNLHKLTI